MFDDKSDESLFYIDQDLMILGKDTQLWEFVLLNYYNKDPIKKKKVWSFFYYKMLWIKVVVPRVWPY